MRKFMVRTMFDAKTFDHIADVVLKDDNGNVVILAEGTTFNAEKPKYSIVEQEMVDVTNRVLASTGSQLLTDDEIKYLLKDDLKEFLNAKLAPTDIQKLAGFEVKKEIMYEGDK